MNTLERIRLRGAVKEAVDNLPEGICFFNRAGLPVLCNHRMHELVFRMTGRDLQVLPELEQALGISAAAGGNAGCRHTMPDGSIWSFSLKTVTAEDGRSYTHAVAFEITELCAEQERLRQLNEAQRHTLRALEEFQKNVVAITREEETLAMKMRLHNDLGYDLQMIRRAMERGFLSGEKARFIARQRDAIRKLGIREEKSGEPLKELMELATSLEMHIDLVGSVPASEPARSLLPLILRECLINAARHAHGDTLYVELCGTDEQITATVANNGAPPDGPVTEGGGLSSLRARIETAGGSMLLKSAPAFCLTAILPVKKEALP